MRQQSEGMHCVSGWYKMISDDLYLDLNVVSFSLCDLLKCKWLNSNILNIDIGQHL